MLLVRLLPCWCVSLSLSLLTPADIGRKAAPKYFFYMNKFSYCFIFSFSLAHSIHSEIHFYPKSLETRAVQERETEAKHHTQWYNVFLPPPRRHWMPKYWKYHTFICSHTLHNSQSLFLDLTSSPIRFEHFIPHWGNLWRS